MKKLICLCFLLCAVGAAASAQPAKTDLSWWQEARFGMFIHFGAYAVPARGEWVRNNERLTNEAYQRYVDMFNPTDYNPREWARLAKAAGMKYAVMTAKHHDGYCLFDSKLTDYTSAKYLKGRDLVREYLDAFRAEGLRVGLYYSVIDWHHPDYPHYGDQHHPQRDDEAFKGKQHRWDNYLQYLHGQVRELTTHYGKLDIMWFDFSYGQMKGEKWKAKELVDMVRKNQPGIILNNRLMGDGAGSLGDASALGDFETPEQGVPDEPRRDAQGQLAPWETCLTLNNNWGYHANDHDWKSPELVVHTLVNCVSKGGNLLLNVGPDARGQIPPQSVAILGEVGEWMKRNGASIYGCGPSPLPKPDWGRFTQRGNRLYAHLMHPHIGHINLKNHQDKVVDVRVLATGVEAFVEQSWWGEKSNNNVFINVKKPTYQHVAPPDPIDTVFEITLK
jgi:alpha-L-fucosidase